jgi:hypothetical protein
MKKSIVCLFVAFTVLSVIFTMAPSVQSQVADSNPVKVLSYSWYVDNLGYLDVIGEVQNTSPNNLNQIGVRCSLLDANGTMIDNRAWFAFALFLPPQQKVPFYVQFPGYDATNQEYIDWSTKGVANVAFNTSFTVTTNYQYPDVQLTNISSSYGQTTDDYGVFWVTGNIQNTGSQTAKNVTVVGTYYNSSGAVVAVGMGEYKNPPNIPASQSVPFKMGAWDKNQSILPQGDRIASSSLSLEVLSPILSGTPPSATPAATYPAPPGGFMMGFSIDTGTLIGVVIVVAIALAGGWLVLKTRKRRLPQQDVKKAQTKPTKKPEARPKKHR